MKKVWVGTSWKMNKNMASSRSLGFCCLAIIDTLFESYPTFRDPAFPLRANGV